MKLSKRAIQILEEIEDLSEEFTMELDINYYPPEDMYMEEVDTFKEISFAELHTRLGEQELTFDD
jgi:hypothetical protein